MLRMVVLELPPNKRLASIRPEIHSKNCYYCAEDVLRRQVLIVAQRMVGIQTAIEDYVGEPVSIASLFESASLKQRKGRTGSFRVHRLNVEEMPGFLDERRQRFDRVLIAAVNPHKWELVEV